MKIKNKFGVFIIIWIVVCLYDNTAAYDDKDTHRRITGKAVEYSTLNNYLIQNLGFKDGIESNIPSNTKNTIRFWLQEGSELEDSPMCRASNHFHNPLLPWNRSYMSDEPWWIATYCGITGYGTKYSGVTWGTGYLSPAPNGTKITISNQEWGWDSARTYYYQALTSSLSTERETYFAKTFQALGQVLHLIEDGAQPAHTRNDFRSHLNFIGFESINPFRWFGSRFENYVKNNSGLVASATPEGLPSFTRLTDFWDTDQYIGNNPSDSLSLGITEFSNANYFSDETIPNNDPTPLHIFSFPQVNNVNAQICEDYAPGSTDKRRYISRNDKGPCPPVTQARTADHFAAISLLAAEDMIRNENIGSIRLWLDDNVHNTYAKELLPRAVGYSAGLLNYFFRGTLEITAPDTYVYSIIDGSSNPQQFTKIKAKVMNTTPNEQIQAGVLQAVAKYKKRTDYQPDLSNDPPAETSREPEFSYSVSAQWTLSSTEISSINTSPVEFTFNFESSPIPAGITDLYLFVIFKGTLGNEADTAIAAGMKDIKEPTHHTFWNLTDRFSLGIYNDTTSTYIYHLYTSDQIKNTPELARLVDLNRNGIFNESGEPYIEPYYIDFKISYMSSLSQEPVGPLAEVQLSPGRYIRLIVLVDSKYNNYVRMAHSDFIDTTGSYYNTTFEGVINQEWENGTWQTPTPIITFRQIRAHFYTGVLRCEPITYDPVTRITYCPYPEEPAPADTTPYQATINFQ